LCGRWASSSKAITSAGSGRGHSFWEPGFGTVSINAGTTDITELAVKSDPTNGLPPDNATKIRIALIEDKFNRPRLMLDRCLLVLGVKSAARCSGRHPRRGDFLSMIEEAMSITLIVFVLIILLFGFHSAETRRLAQQANKRRGKIRAGNLGFWKSRSLKARNK
jgi:hypothetical protein